MKFLLIGLVSLININVYANDNLLASCQPIAIKDAPMLLKNIQPMLLLFHNISTNDVWLTHIDNQSKTTAGWSSRFSTNRWSALILDKNDIKLTCIESKPGHEQQVSCMGLITICAWPNVKIPATPIGTFWAVENMALSSMINHLSNQRFILPTLAK
jgi:hypothetical protein